MLRRGFQQKKNTKKVLKFSKRILTIPSKAPYDAIAIPTPETPIAGVTTCLVNSAL
jgi:hypothetical protein